MRRWWGLIGVIVLAGCASRTPAPVVDRSPQRTVGREAGAVVPGQTIDSGASTSGAAAPGSAAGFYTVKKGDTLYRIALEHGVDRKDLAAWNLLDDASRIEIGQQLRLTPPDAGAVVKPIASPGPIQIGGESSASPLPMVSTSDSVKHEPKGGKLPYSEHALAQVRALDGGAVRSETPVAPIVEKPVVSAPPVAPVVPVTPPNPAAGDDAVQWGWPVPGKVLTPFVDSAGGRETNKGVDIAAKPGEPVLAAAAGKVVYVGNSLRGYGNLVIVRHNATYLSAYAHNSKILVKEGQAIAKAQKIAEAGSSDTDQPKLHFEIRRSGKPVDPLKYLPSR